jgi:predicted nucleotidyltransferase
VDRLTEVAPDAADRWPHIWSAFQRTASARAKLEPVLTEHVNAEDTSVVVFGSLARGELTRKSDADWALLLDGQCASVHFKIARAIGKVFTDEDFKSAGREGTFEGFAVSHELLHKIGGEDDTNRNLTQRILLILESAAIGPAAARARVVRNLLERYIVEDAGWSTGAVAVPRFLLNDIARYWRTVAVDFAYKRRDREAKGWGIRTIKLRLSRKLTFVSGLLTCFAASRVDGGLGDDRARRVIERIEELIELTPLERAVLILREFDQAASAMQILSAYDSFLELLGDDVARGALECVTAEGAASDPTYQRAREIGHQFQSTLDAVFFTDAKPTPGSIPALARKYGFF